MQDKNQEILAIIVLGSLIALLLVGFILTMLFLYQKRQHIHKKEMAVMQEDYDKQILKVQFEMQEATLSEISNKLHDSLKNNINSIILNINAISMGIKNKILGIEETTIQLQELSGNLIIIREEIRLTSHSLSSDRITVVGLVDAIKSEARRLQKLNTFEVQTNIQDSPLYFFKKEESVYLFRMFQEIIGNVLTHSKATKLTIDISLLPQNIFYLQIADNGIGFNVSEKKKSKLSGIGLSGMQKRALQIGADFKIESKETIGTTIQIKLPLTLPDKNNVNAAQKPQAKHSFN